MPSLPTNPKIGNYFRSKHSRMPRDIHILEYKYIFKNPTNFKTVSRLEPE